MKILIASDAYFHITNGVTNCISGILRSFPPSCCPPRIWRPSGACRASPRERSRPAWSRRDQASALPWDSPFSYPRLIHDPALFPTDYIDSGQTSFRHARRADPVLLYTGLRRKRSPGVLPPKNLTIILVRIIRKKPGLSKSYKGGNQP